MSITPIHAPFTRKGSGGWLEPLAIVENEAEINWPMGTVVQEIHTGDCCGSEEPFCYFYEQLWVMQFQMGWMRAGAEYYDENDDPPRMPVRLLWHPEWAKS